jgi:hypothetical protein
VRLSLPVSAPVLPVSDDDAGAAGRCIGAGRTWCCRRSAARGFGTSAGEFEAWAEGRGRRRLLLEDFYRAGDAPLASVEGFVRQLIGWRDYVWHLYWHLGEGYRHRNALRARTPRPDWFTQLDADAVQARCLSDALARVREHGCAHPIIRLMVPNVVGMSQHADGGLMATKPYAGGGAYINRPDHEAICAMSAGRTRQHPPMTAAPAALHCRGSAGEYPDCPAQARRRASHSSPLLGYTITGLPVTSRAAAMAGSTSAGAQQLTPTATTSGPPAATANASASGCPARVRPPAMV